MARATTTFNYWLLASGGKEKREQNDDKRIYEKEKNQDTILKS